MLVGLVIGAATPAPVLAQGAGVDVCVARGDGGYATVTVLTSELERYRGGRNIVPAPAGGCPGRGGDGRGAAGRAPTTTTPPAAPLTATPTAATIAPGGQLPNTGGEPLLVCLLGIGFVLSGVGLRLRTLRADL